MSVILTAILRIRYYLSLIFSFSCSFSARRSSSFFPILCAISLLRFCFLLPFCTLPPSMLLSLYTFLLPVLQQSPFHAICRCSAHMQCCWSGSGNRCLFNPWIRDPEKFFFCILDLASQTHIFESLVTIFLGKKYLNSL